MGWGFRTAASWPARAIVGMNRAMNLADMFGQRDNQNSIIAAAGQSGFYHAMDMVGNKGQMTLIEELGVGSFIEAAQAFAENDEDPADVLMGLSSHPEAVEQILTEAGEVIMEALDTGRQGRYLDKI